MMRGKEGVINRGDKEPKSKRQTSDRPAGPKGDGAKNPMAGSETKANVKGAQLGGSMAEAAGNPLTGAKNELRSQHPHDYTDHGPHHGGTEHIRHMPLHGMKPSGYGR